MNTNYEQLIRKFCSAVRLPGVDNILAGAPFETGGVVFSLTHNAQAAPDCALIHADFGPLPERGKKTILYTLMEENFLAAMGPGGSFGISSLTGNVVYAEEFSIKGATPEKLYDRLEHLWTQATEWRESYFLYDRFGKPKTVRGASSHPLMRNYSARN